MLFMELLLRNEFLDLINGNSLIHRAPRAGILAAPVADRAAHGREWIVLFDQLQCIQVTPLRRHLYVALHRQVRRARGLARRCAGLIAVDLRMVPVIRIPFVAPPLLRIRKKRFRVLDLAVLRAQLLAQFGRAHRTDFHALSAGHAFLFFHVGPVCGAGHIRRIEKLGRPESVADARRAVADGEDLLLAVDIGNLVHESVPLGPLQDLHHFVQVDIAALPCLHKIIRHVPDADAQIPFDLAAPLAAHPLLAAAGAGAHRVFVLVFPEPVGNVLHTRRLLLRRDRLLHRNDMHPDAGAARRHHRRHLLKGKPRHIFKKFCDNRMFFGLLLVHHHELRAAGHEHRKHILFMPVRIFPVVLDHADDRHLIQ